MQRSVVAVLVLLALLLQGTWVLAGTTGSITGIVTDTVSGKPVGNATVTAASPSQAASVQTDSAGRYNFVSLSPDTYAGWKEHLGHEIYEGFGPSGAGGGEPCFSPGTSGSARS